jgi:hypothetical protein
MAEQVVADANPKEKVEFEELLQAWAATNAKLDNAMKFFATRQFEVRKSQVQARTFGDDPKALDLHDVLALKQRKAERPQGRTAGVDVRSLIVNEQGQPQGRSMIDAVNGILGLFNTYENKKTHALAAAATKAMKAVMVEVSGLKEFSTANAENLDEIAVLVKTRSWRQGAIELSHFWAQTKILVSAVARLAASATQQRLDPAITNIVDMERLWETFRLKVGVNDWVPPFTHSQHIYQLKADFEGTPTRVRIQVHVPLRQKQATEWTLFRFLQRPILHDKALLLDIMPDRSRIAVNTKMTAYLDIERDELDECLTLPDVMFCPPATRVVHTNSDSSCLAALYWNNWTAIRALCWMRLSPPHSTAWATGPNNFTLLLPQETTAAIRCEHRPTMSVKLHGYLSVYLHETCVLITDHFSLHATNNGLDNRVDIELEAEEAHSWLERLTFNTANITLKHPTAVTAVNDRVRHILEEGESWSLFKMSTGTKIALGLAISAMILVGVFLVVVYIRIKCVNTTPLQMALRTVGRWAKTTTSTGGEEEHTEAEEEQEQEQEHARGEPVTIPI